MSNESLKDKEIIEFYNKSNSYLESLIKHNNKNFNDILNTFYTYIPKELKVLEIGCGTGQLANLLANSGYMTTGSDLSNLFITQAKQMYSSPNLEYFVDNSNKSIFLDNSYDVVFSYCVLEHSTDPLSMLSEMNRIVKNNGFIIIALPNLLDPKYHLKKVFSWQNKKHYLPWESTTRIGAFFKFISNGSISLLKLLGVNKKIYKITPFLSEEEEFCGQDYDATWLANPFDVQNFLKDSNYKIISQNPNKLNSSFFKLLYKIHFPKTIIGLLYRLRGDFIIVGQKIN